MHSWVPLRAKSEKQLSEFQNPSVGSVVPAIRQVCWVAAALAQWNCGSTKAGEHDAHTFLRRFKGMILAPKAEKIRGDERKMNGHWLSACFVDDLKAARSMSSAKTLQWHPPNSEAAFNEMLPAKHDTDKTNTH